MAKQVGKSPYQTGGRNEQKKDDMPLGKPVAGSKVNKVDPKQPVYRTASGYKLEEDVNQGPHGGKKGMVKAGHGQNNYQPVEKQGTPDPGEHNALVDMSDMQKDPYRVRGGDWTVKRVHARTEQDGVGDYGYSEGHNELVAQSLNQEGPRHNEDDGQMTPVPGDRSRVVASGCPIEINKGESDMDTGEVAIEQEIDLQSGHIRGGDGGPIQWVPQFNVSVGKPLKNTKDAGFVGQNRK